MEDNLIALAIPFFLLLIGVELLVARVRGLSLYRFNDAVTDLSCGIGSQAVGVLNKVLLLAVYVAAYEHLRLMEWSGWPAWVLAFVGIDFAYYWWHRASHRVNALWASHVVHHQSQDYNLAVALRQAWFTSYGMALFHLPLAILGVPPLQAAIADAVNTLYQFWIHTRAIGRLGPLEWVLNTASHHRVHHGVNPRYIDKNYAGILIVWDRMFGTFEEEREEVVYGTVAPYQSWNGVWANFEPWTKLIGQARRARGLDRLRVFFAPPEWTPEGPLQIPEVDARSFAKWDTDTPRAVQAYVLAWLAAAIGAIVAMLAVEKSADPATLVALGVGIVATLHAFGGLLEGRSWALPFELGRLLGLTGLVALLAPTALPVALVAAAVSAGALLWLRPRLSAAGVPT